jgi:hypothetical protein
MCGGDPSADRETEPAARGRFPLSQISLIEAIENVPAYVFGHAHTCVAHGHKCAVRYNRYFSANLARLRRVSNCIVQKDANQALQQ